MGSSDNLFERSFAQKYEDLKKDKQYELAKFRESNEEEAYKAGYYYNDKTDSYEKIPIAFVCETFIVSISKCKADVVKRENIIKPDLYYRAKKAINDCNCDEALKILAKVDDADFFNTSSNIFDQGYSSSKIAIMDGARVSNFLKTEDYSKVCFLNFNVECEEIAGSFEFDIPYYHVQLTFYSIKEPNLEELLSDLKFGGRYETISTTWTPRESKRK